jgi:hypothetical protein
MAVRSQPHSAFLQAHTPELSRYMGGGGSDLLVSDQSEGMIFHVHSGIFEHFILLKQKSYDSLVLFTLCGHKESVLSREAIWPLSKGDFDTSDPKNHRQGQENALVVKDRSRGELICACHSNNPYS